MNYKKIVSISCIIFRMIELYKRCWQVFFPLFGLFTLGSLQSYIYLFLEGRPYGCLISIILAVMAVICLLIGIIAFIFDVKDSRRKDRERGRLI